MPEAADSKFLPRINWMYWLLIISATTIGETGGDYIAHDLHLGYLWSSIVMVGLFVIALLVSLSFRIQHRAVYWTVIILTSTAGTNMADLVTRQMMGTYGDRTPTTIKEAHADAAAGTQPGHAEEEPEPIANYGMGSAVIVAALAAIFIAWKTSARNVSIDQPLSKTTEFLYWCAILASSTLGTAFGDFLSDDSGLNMGFTKSTSTLLVLLAILAAVAHFTKFSRSVLYWAAIILTHPLGATAGDLMTKDREAGGFELGTVKATVILTVIFLAIAVLNYLIGESTPPPSTYDA